MKKILLIDNTFDPPHGSPEIRENLESAAKAFGAIEVVMVRAPESGIPADLSEFNGAVLSGSKTRIEETAPWIEKELEAIRQLHARRIPTLGICYGEQMIARALGGADVAGVAVQSEHGWAEIELRGTSPVLQGLPEKFYSYQYHSDEVKRLPPNFRLTATNAACSIQAFDVTDAPMWGVQFHPERALELGNKRLDQRLREDPTFPALNRDKAEQVYSDAVAATIFRNFLAQVWLGR